MFANAELVLKNKYKYKTDLGICKPTENGIVDAIYRILLVLHEEYGS
jgi:hypothetical protein